jgi:hypothetical protein
VKLFQQQEIREAIACASAGGQALHLMSGAFAYGRPNTPNCFKSRSQLAHLFDQDRERLIQTARQLGVRVIKVERENTNKQHIDLCGQPLEHAKQQTTQTTNPP